ncbi:transglutaminase domain-containing protein [Paenibacillus sp. F411]|uniref:transglutaminase domain-containing protein n=1 Tax=Paenibacillus sp. F411 TaxID=2820239 RepID=UPI001AAF9607|nr:transglutaminase domain-containing protein [Paenibacillus sp. F411]MBO2944662.1 transglutaminase domain-containing protein [Paenibacillus sp. F411]
MSEALTSVFSLREEDQVRLRTRLAQKRLAAGPREGDLFGVFDQDLSEEELWALTYLYAYMPINDMADYDGALFLSHVRQTLRIRKSVPWGERVPDPLFLHFVLPYRVNTEHIENSRGLLHGELAERTSRLSMKEAILETNYWCHEKATYIGSDLRTASPLTTLRAARGRCGEESTLAVSALRSIGIPARQIYTPRWAHCDDNHAWVEAWADGEWYFIGACEPEASLNEGWFGPPARRAMLINNRVFSHYPGPEDITLTEDAYTEINVLENYAPARTIEVQVQDEKGRPVQGADVRFELYNMAELYPIAILKSDEQGRARFKTGYGDLIIRAVKGGVWHEVKNTPVDFGTMTLVLNTSAPPQGSVELDLVPPPELEGKQPPLLSQEQLQRHQERLAAGTALREAYEATFPGPQEAEDLAREKGLPQERVWEVLKKARGNGYEMSAFLRRRPAEEGQWPLLLLESLNEKDLIDTFSPVLQDHLEGALPYAEQYAEAWFQAYVLCPRVLHEMIVPYRREISESFTPEEREEFRGAPSELADRLEKGYTYREDLPNLKGRGNPLGTFRLHSGDELSLSILFVAAARSLGIPARLHPSEQKPQYYQDGRWCNAIFCRQATRKEPAGEWGRLQLLRDPDAGAGAPSAAYAQSFTLARLEHGVYKTLVFPYGKSDVYDEPFEVEPGAYRLTTGVRMKDGTVHIRLSYTTVVAGQTTEAVLSFRSVQEGIPILGALDHDLMLSSLADHEVTALGDRLGTAGALVAWLEPEREPSKHLLREWGELAESIEQYGIPVIMLMKPEWASAFSLVPNPELPEGIVFAAAGEEGLPDFIGSSLAGEAGYPHLFAVDAQCRIRYTASGYKIGMGKEALKTLLQLGLS